MTDRRSALFELTLTRFREFYREPGAVFWAFGFPIVLVLVLGLAFRDHAPGHPRVAIERPAPEWLVEALVAAKDEVDVEMIDAVDAERALRIGKVDLVVRMVDAEGAAGVTYRYDVAREGSRLARRAADDAIQRFRGRRDSVVTDDDHVEESGGRYVDFLFPGILGLNLMGSSMWAIGFSIVVARKRKMLKRLAATPMRRSQFVLSYFLSRLVFLVFEIGILLLFAKLIFRVENHGSTLLLACVALLGAAAFAAVSLVIAARAQSLEAAYGWMNAIQLPMWLLSGSFFSYERFPELVHPYIRVLPLTALNDALRAVMNEGAGAREIWMEVGILAAVAAVGFAVSQRVFRWQ